MRPKKRILLVGSNDDQLATIRFMLETNGFAVFSAESRDAAVGIAAECPPDATLIFCPLTGIEKLIEELRTLTAGRGSVVIDERNQAPVNLFADAVLNGRIHAADLLERMKVFTAHKRGPKKQVQSEAAAAILARRIA